MIEVEKKFQPTDEQLAALLDEAEFVGSVINHDIYYDYSDFRLLKEEVRLRKRNNIFELKAKLASSSHLELEKEEEIKNYLKINKSLEDFIKDELVVIIEYKNNREKYKKGEFSIDIDKLDFGYNMCEIELLVEKEDQIQEANEKIINFAKQYNFSMEKILSKGAEYLRRFNPEKYQEILGDK